MTKKRLTTTHVAYIIRGVRTRLSYLRIAEKESVDSMERSSKYLYKIALNSNADVIEFNRVATRYPGKVHLVSGNKRLNAKSFLGVHLAKLAWSEIFIECDDNCYFEFRKFIVD